MRNKMKLVLSRPVPALQTSSEPRLDKSKIITSVVTKEISCNSEMGSEFLGIGHYLALGIGLGLKNTWITGS